MISAELENTVYYISNGDLVHLDKYDYTDKTVLLEIKQISSTGKSAYIVLYYISDNNYCNLIASSMKKISYSKEFDSLYVDYTKKEGIKSIILIGLHNIMSGEEYIDLFNSNHIGLDAKKINN